MAKSNQKEGVFGASGHPTSILFLTAFSLDFLRFEVHLSCSVRVVRRDSVSGHAWCGLLELI